MIWYDELNIFIYFLLVYFINLNYFNLITYACIYINVLINLCY